MKASDYPMISNEKQQLQKQYDNIQLQSPKNIQFVEGKLFEKVNEIEILNHNDQNKLDVIAAFADKINGWYWKLND